MSSKPKAPANRTLVLTSEERAALEPQLLTLSAPAAPSDLEGRVLCGDFFAAAAFLPRAFVDLLIVDPPYNLTKNYNGNVFRSQKRKEYQRYFRTFIEKIRPALRPDASVYVCSDWQTSTLVFPILDEFFTVRNRITWEREKGRGSKTNWKNNTEDIWFCTAGESYYFDVEAVKMKRRVLAPYRTQEGKPKDWDDSKDEKFRMTHPSNFWSDLTIPFWSMPENTDHPTQKPEKLMAKLILASSAPGAFVFDPFFGSGTTLVTAQKLGRRFSGIEQNPEYGCWALRRLELARSNPAIQGYEAGVFRERNTHS